ncbi:MAG: hypothetical protein FWE07_05900 [Turicibacter sp.]|nr:hypothetical protein [Turicibacter sp.]
MKKLLGLTALVAVLVLAACGGGSSNDVVCTGEIDFWGVEMQMTATPAIDGDYVTSVEMEMRMDLSTLGIDVSELDDEDIAALEEDMDGVIDGDYIVVTDSETLPAGETLEDFIADMEMLDLTCD